MFFDGVLFSVVVPARAIWLFDCVLFAVARRRFLLAAAAVGHAHAGASVALALLPVCRAVTGAQAG